jgi:hypothetical protein
MQSKEGFENPKCKLLSCGCGWMGLRYSRLWVVLSQARLHRMPKFLCPMGGPKPGPAPTPIKPPAPFGKKPRECNPKNYKIATVKR